MREPVKFHWRGNHHSYYGIFFIAFGLFNWYMGIDNIEELIPLWQVITGLGVVMIIDDFIEHKITASTPLRILWKKVIYPMIKNKNGN